MRAAPGHAFDDVAVTAISTTKSSLMPESRRLAGWCGEAVEQEAFRAIGFDDARLNRTDDDGQKPARRNP